MQMGASQGVTVVIKIISATIVAVDMVIGMLRLRQWVLEAKSDHVINIELLLLRLIERFDLGVWISKLLVDG